MFMRCRLSFVFVTIKDEKYDDCCGGRVGDGNMNLRWRRTCPQPELYILTAQRLIFVLFVSLFFFHPRQWREPAEASLSILIEQHQSSPSRLIQFETNQKSADKSSMGDLSITDRLNNWRLWYTDWLTEKQTIQWEQTCELENSYEVIKSSRVWFINKQAALVCSLSYSYSSFPDAWSERRKMILKVKKETARPGRSVDSNDF